MCSDLTTYHVQPWILVIFREESLPRLLDIPRGCAELLSILLPATRPLDRGNGGVCKITPELTAVLEVDVFILSFCLAIRSLLRSITSVGYGNVFLPRSATNSASNTPGLF